MTVDLRYGIESASLRHLAATLGLIVAGIHLYWGMPRFVGYLNVGWILQPDPRPLAFVLSGHALLLGLTLGALDVVDRRILYVGGILLACVYLLGYGAWHTILDHGGFWPWAPSGSSHGGSPLSTVAGHLLSDRFVFVSKLAELGLIAVLGVLYRQESTD